MQLSKQDIEIIKKFNRNVDWLKKSRLELASTPPPQVEETSQWLTVRDAMKFINRSRTWLSNITIINPGDARNPSMMLIKGLDWKRVTNQIYYKRQSLENVKKGMEKAGDSFDQRLLRQVETQD